MPYITYEEERELKKLRDRVRELEEENKRLKRGIRELEEKVSRLKKQVVKIEKLKYGSKAIHLPREVRDLVWSLIMNRGWRAYRTSCAGADTMLLSVRTEEGEVKLFLVDGGIVVLSDVLAEKLCYEATPIGHFEPQQGGSLPKEIRGSLPRALARFFSINQLEHKIVVFLTEILPLVEASGIVVGDPSGRKPFLVWGDDQGSKAEIYTPTQAYRLMMRAETGDGFVNVNGLRLSYAACLETLILFMNYAIRMIAARWPGVLKEAFGIASSRGLPKTSLAEALAPLEEAGEGGEG
ncbi:MAG: hypothetical protein DRO06_03440 [Thermoproteota archaeon]|nr:MAG: hypothetical protein DRO06_03440 [Candidatus Korarchaeota archaeon]